MMIKLFMIIVLAFLTCKARSQTLLHSKSSEHSEHLVARRMEWGKNPIYTIYGHSDDVNSVRFSPDGKTLVSGSCDGTICIWDLEKNGAMRNSLEEHKDCVLSVEFSPDGKTLASGAWDGNIIIWDLNKNGAMNNILSGHTQRVSSIAFSPDGKRLASGSRDSTIRIWDLENSGVLLNTIKRKHWFESVAFSPDGKMLASGSSDKKIRLWNMDKNNGTFYTTLKGHTEHINAVTFSPDGKTLASASNDGTIRVWDLENNFNITHTLSVSTSRTLSVTYSPDGKTLVSGSHDNAIRIWDLGNKVVIKTLTKHNYPVKTVAFSPNGETLASGSFDTNIKVWEFVDVSLQPSSQLSSVPSIISDQPSISKVPINRPSNQPSMSTGPSSQLVSLELLAASNKSSDLSDLSAAPPLWMLMSLVILAVVGIMLYAKLCCRRDEKEWSS